MHGAYRIPINTVSHYPEIKKACKPLLSPQAFLPHKAIVAGFNTGVLNPHKSIDTDHNGCSLDNSQSVLALFQSKILYGVVGNGCGDGAAAQRAHTHN